MTLLSSFVPRLFAPKQKTVIFIYSSFKLLHKSQANPDFVQPQIKIRMNE